jgi:single-strand DNA-binding protein
MINHLAMQGRLVEDPTFGNTNAGGRYANFRIAWSEKYKEKENKCFLECKAFSGTAEFMEKYMNKKGQELLVEGKLNTDEWEKDGQKRSKIVLMVSGVHFCGSRKDSSTDNTPVPTPVDVGDALPF